MADVCLPKEAEHQRQDRPQRHRIDDDHIEETIAEVGIWGNAQIAAIVPRIGGRYLQHLLLNLPEIAAEADPGRLVANDVPQRFQDIAGPPGTKALGRFPCGG